MRNPFREAVPGSAFLAHVDFETVSGEFREPVDVGRVYRDTAGFDRVASLDILE